jgi:hypothetical protein
MFTKELVKGCILLSVLYFAFRFDGDYGRVNLGRQFGEGVGELLQVLQACCMRRCRNLCRAQQRGADHSDGSFHVIFPIWL